MPPNVPSVERSLRKSRADTNKRRRLKRDLDYRRLLQKFLAKKAEVRELRQQLKPIRYEIWEAGWIQIHEPGGEASVLLEDRERARRSNWISLS